MDIDGYPDDPYEPAACQAECMPDDAAALVRLVKPRTLDGRDVMPRGEVFDSIRQEVIAGRLSMPLTYDSNGEPEADARLFIQAFECGRRIIAGLCPLFVVPKPD